jgi:hypothetical protein
MKQESGTAACPPSSTWRVVSRSGENRSSDVRCQIGGAVSDYFHIRRDSSTGNIVESKPLKLELQCTN